MTQILNLVYIFAFYLSIPSPKKKEEEENLKEIIFQQ